jgi:dipeptidyl aminopeptidase/acylaminoacyl peptidase
MLTLRGRVALFAMVPLSLAAQSAPRTAFTAHDALDVSTAQLLDLSSDGRWLALSVAARRDGLGVDYRRDTDPTYLRVSPATLRIVDTRDGSMRNAFQDARTVRGAVWSPDATKLAVLGVRSDRVEATIWDRGTGRARILTPPAGLYIAENSDIRWTSDGMSVLVALRQEAWRRTTSDEFARMTRGPVFVQDGTEPFLAWDRLRREGNMRAIYSINVATNAATELLPNGMYASYHLTDDDSLLIYTQDNTKKTDYDVIFGAENRLMLRRRAGTAGSTEVMASLKGITPQYARDGRRFAYARDGRVYVRSVTDAAPRQIAGPDSATASRLAADTSPTGKVANSNARFSVLRMSPTGDAVLVQNGRGIWIAPVDQSPMTLIGETNDTLPMTPRATPVAWSEDGRYVYLSVAARTQWMRGVARFDRTTGARDELLRDERLFSNFRLSRSADVMVYAAGAGNRTPDFYASDNAMKNPRRLTTLNPQLATKTLASTRLINYRDADGKTRYGVVYLPADYSRERKYPTLFQIYEDFFDDTFDASLNVLTSQGYVVVKPSVGFETGFPGEAWLKGVTAAANAVIDAGISDSSRLGVYGTSYGGYATNLLITQTNRFRAALNVSGKVNMVSFYTDSPRLGVRNTHAAEKSQDRIGATLWQAPQKYIAHSAVMFADRITTPLLLVTGAQDPNVPAENTREMYYALRRLGKPVTWVNYMNSGHGTPGTTVEDFIDYHDRIGAFFDRHLKAAPRSTVVEATSLLGQPLLRPEPTGATRERMETQLADARRAYERAPQNADSLIWFGRRTAYLGRFTEAIAIFSRGIEQHPGDARMYHHRGHRYLSTRQLPKAISDFEKALAMTRGTPDQVEPDGQPNARNIPTSSLQSNIRYHLGLAYYLTGQFEKALPIYRDDLAAAHGNPDETVATSHWLYMALRRLGRTDEAAHVLAPISAQMDVIENGIYHRLLLLYKGELAVTDILKSFGTDGNVDDVTTAYGVGNWHLYNGRVAEADAIFSRILAAQSQWASFGYLTAESEKARGARGGR